jgi:hypothetical protein
VRGGEMKIIKKAPEKPKVNMAVMYSYQHCG